MVDRDADPASDKAGYSAPALEKGLDIIELLAGSPEPLTARLIGDRLGRSKNEIFRMVYVLVERGYLKRDTSTDQLTLSNKLFELGMRTPVSRQLVEVALPIMEELSREVGHSAHLVVINKGETVVIANAVGGSDISFSLQLGYRRPAIAASSGQTIIAFQSPEVRRKMIAESQAVANIKSDSKSLVALLDSIVADGSTISESHNFVGVTDICGPILSRSGQGIASLVMPCLRKRSEDNSYEVVRAALVSACRRISQQIL